MNKSTRSLAIAVFGMLILLASTVWFSPWSFRGRLADAIVIALGFISYVTLVFGILSLRPSVGARLAKWILAGPVLLVAGIGTFGVIGIAKAENELTPKALREIDAEHNYCWIVVGGCHGTCSEARLTFFYHPRRFPFIEKQIWESQYFEQQYDLEYLQISKVIHAEAAQVTLRKHDGALEVVIVPFR